MIFFHVCNLNLCIYFSKLSVIVHYGLMSKLLDMDADDDISMFDRPQNNSVVNAYIS